MCNPAIAAPQALVFRRNVSREGRLAGHKPCPADMAVSREERVVVCVPHSEVMGKPQRVLAITVIADLGCRRFHVRRMEQFMNQDVVKVISRAGVDAVAEIDLIGVNARSE